MKIARLQIEQVKGWEIEQSEFDSMCSKDPLIKDLKPIEQPQQSIFKIIIPKSQNNSVTRTPLPSVHEPEGRSQAKKKCVITPKIPQPQQQQPLTMTKFRLNIKDSQQPQKSYSSSQLQSMLQLKRKNLYLQYILKKVNKKNDERFIKQSCSQQDLFLGSDMSRKPSIRMSPNRSIHFSGTHGVGGFNFNRRRNGSIQQY